MKCNVTRFSCDDNIFVLLMKTKNPKSILSLIESCKTIRQLKQIHAQTIISSLSYNQILLSKILKSFLHMKPLSYANRLFNGVYEPNLFFYNALIKAYTSSENPRMAILIFNQMRVRGNLIGDEFTYPFVLKACAGEFTVEKGKEIHGLIVRIGFEADQFLYSSLLSFYSVCGEMENARRVFDEFVRKDIVFWNAMIMGYARNGMVLEARGLFGDMIRVEKFKPIEGTLLGIISACMVSKNLKLGREIHGYVTKEIPFDVGVKVGAALLDMYVKCGSLIDARKLFDKLPVKNTVVWNSLISGYCQTGLLSLAIDIFREMHLSNVKPDKFTISALLSACAQMGALNLGTWVRKFAEKEGIWDVVVGTSLVDMYAKCGSVGVARELFDQMHQRNLTTWNSILSGYAANGQPEPAIELFNEMRNSGVIPDSVTFLAILHACAHAGLVEKGKQYFDLMTKHYGMNPKIQHYGCMIDLLGRAGRLKEAKELIERMDVEPSVTLWGALLSACSIHGDVEIGEWAAYHIFQLDPMDGGSYVLLANMYSTAGRYNGVKAVRQIMVQRGICKPPGCSMIEIGNVVYEFTVAENMHPRYEEIYSVLNEISQKLKMGSYVFMLGLDEECLEISLFAQK